MKDSPTLNSLVGATLIEVSLFSNSVNLVFEAMMESPIKYILKTSSYVISDKDLKLDGYPVSCRAFSGLVSNIDASVTFFQRISDNLFKIEIGSASIFIRNEDPEIDYTLSIVRDRNGNIFGAEVFF